MVFLWFIHIRIACFWCCCRRWCNLWRNLRAQKTSDWTLTRGCHMYKLIVETGWLLMHNHTWCFEALVYWTDVRIACQADRNGQKTICGRTKKKTTFSLNHSSVRNKIQFSHWWIWKRCVAAAVFYFRIFIFSILLSNRFPIFAVLVLFRFIFLQFIPYAGRVGQTS